jgi:hypothetical protein
MAKYYHLFSISKIFMGTELQMPYHSFLLSCALLARCFTPFSLYIMVRNFLINGRMTVIAHLRVISLGAKLALFFLVSINPCFYHY